MKTELISPRLVTIKLTQEKDDPDYGSCLWARFMFDLDRYSMQIMSDCGNYAYAWHPTPDTESFLHLIRRMESDYLLGKISNQTVVDADTTYKAVIHYLEELKDYKEIDEENSYDPDDILSACNAYTERDCMESLMRVLDATSYFQNYDYEDLAYCVQTQYPANARKVGEIFEKYIKPLARKMGKEGTA